MPELAQLHTPPSVIGAAIAARAAGTSKRQIARDLAIDRKTVDNILRAVDQDKPKSAITDALIQPSYDAVLEGLTSTDARIKATDRASIGLRVLESTVWSHNAQPATHINIERFASISQLMPSTPSPPSSTSANALAVPAVLDIPAVPKQPQSPPETRERKASPTIFSLADISTEDLRAELAKREAGAPLLPEGAPCP